MDSTVLAFHWSIPSPSPIFAEISANLLKYQQAPNRARVCSSGSSNLLKPPQSSSELIRAFQWLLQPPQSSSEALLKPPQTSSEMQGGFSEEANLDINGARVTHPISGFLFTFGYWHFIVEAKYEFRSELKVKYVMVWKMKKGKSIIHNHMKRG